MAAQPAGAVGRGRHHPPRAAQQRRRARHQIADRDLLLQMAARIRDALRAGGQLRLAAIPPLPPDQRDPRTEPVIVVHMHIERHAEPRRQPRTDRVVAEQVVQFDRLRPVGAEQRRQVLDLVGQAIDQRVIVGLRAVADRNPARDPRPRGIDRRAQHDRPQPGRRGSRRSARPPAAPPRRPGRG